MTRILKDSEIQELIEEVKPLSENWEKYVQPRQKSGYQHEERNFGIKGENGSDFRVILRRNRLNVFDFCIILIFRDKDGKEYRLIRYNGKHSSQHTNKWEKEQGYQEHTFGPAFHIHKATQRYQEADYPIDGYAKVTTTYYDFNSALTHFLRDNNFKKPESSQMDFFEGGDSYDHR